jgi:Na+/melibiose symporter-like transporter
LLLLPLVVPTSRDPQHRRLDLGGAVLSTAALTVLLYGIIEGPRSGWTARSVIGGLVIGAALLVVFLAWERRRETPMLPLDLFSKPRFSAAAAALSLTFLGLFGYIFLLTQYLQFVRGMSPLAAGLRLAPPAVGLIVGAPLAPRLVERIGTKVVVATGLGIACAALILGSRPVVLRQDILLLPVFACFGLGMGLTMAPATDSIMGSVPRDRAGVGSAVNDTTRQTGGALGVAVLGSLAATRYNAAVNSLHLPAQLTGALRQSIGTAASLVGRLPHAEAQRVVASARHGFTDGVSVAATAGAVVVGGAALIVVVWLPSREPGALSERDRDEHPQPARRP